MRLISQDRKEDICYEKSRLIVEDYSIKAFISYSPRPIEMAKYSTENKVLEVGKYFIF